MPRPEPTIELTAAEKRGLITPTQAAVKVIDIFGNDTMTPVPVPVPVRVGA